mgnify:FL=1
MNYKRLFIAVKRLQQKSSALYEDYIPVIVLVLMVAASIACVRHEVNNMEDVDGRVTPVGNNEDNPRTLPGTYMPGMVREMVYSTVVVSGTPTPDVTRPAQVVPAAKNYVVKSGDTLSAIARMYKVSVRALREANNLPANDMLVLGQSLEIPDNYLPLGSNHKLIPDSELVYGPGQIGFDITEYLSKWDSYLNAVSETDHRGITRNGSEIVKYVAENYSVNPRLLIAILEQQTGWVMGSNAGDVSLTYPFGYVRPGYKGLLRQLSWAADTLNYGFYGWREDTLQVLDLIDGSQLAIAPGLNAGTVAVQFYFSKMYSSDIWPDIVSESGFDRLYAEMFGSAFGYAYEPLLPSYLEQPDFEWPWDRNEVWYFTGGPHGGWDSGSAWAGIDFGPPGGASGCQVTQAWIRASADGQIVRSSEGAVVQDFDGDGYEQTGWNLLYMHIYYADRVPVGKTLKTGDLIGHPSCEGGYSSATHLHFARKYNGVWIAADDPEVPFNLDGWLVRSARREYDGWLVKDDKWIEALYYPGSINAIVLSP